MFFPTIPDPALARPALDVCTGCPVRAECLADALEWHPSYDYGIRGGHTENERRNMRRTGRRQTLSPLAHSYEHGTHNGYNTHRRVGEDPCPDCKTGEALYRGALRRASSDTPH